MEEIKWKNNSKTFIERYFYVITIICCTFVLLLIFNIPVLKMSIPTQILLLILAIIIACLPYFYFFHYYCAFPDQISINSVAIYFKKGKRIFQINLENINLIKNHGRLLEIQLKKPKYYRSFWIEERHIKEIMEHFNHWQTVCRSTGS